MDPTKEVKATQWPTKWPIVATGQWKSDQCLNINLHEDWVKEKYLNYRPTWIPVSTKNGIVIYDNHIDDRNWYNTYSS